MQPVATNSQHNRLEARGWLLLAAVIIMFPTLFFLCVFLPIWLGWAPRY